MSKYTKTMFKGVFGYQCHDGILRYGIRFRDADGKYKHRVIGSRLEDARAALVVERQRTLRRHMETGWDTRRKQLAAIRLHEQAMKSKLRRAETQLREFRRFLADCDAALERMDELLNAARDFHDKRDVA